MATLKVANVHFDTAGTNRLEYLGGDIPRIVGKAIALPKGNTSQRPTGEEGLIRYNTQTGTFEGYNATTWGAIGGVPDTTLPQAAFLHANLAFNKANSANIIAQAGVDSAVAVDQKADFINTRALSAFSMANSANVHANTAFNLANTSNIRLNAAFAKANAALANTTGAVFSGNLIITNNVSPVGVVAQALHGTIRASAAQFHTGTSNTNVLTPWTVWEAAKLVPLTDATTITVNLGTGVNFGGASETPLTIAGNRTLGNPTGMKSGQSGVIWVNATGETRTLTLAANWLVISGVEVGPYSITTTQILGIVYVVIGTSVYVTSIIRRG